MAEITIDDLFSEEAMRAPRELAASLGMVAKGIDSITQASKESEKALRGATSVSKIAKETEQLTIQEKELIKVQNQITVALAKNNDEYIEHKRGLDAINRATKEKIQKGREDLTFTGQMKNAMNDLKQELKDAKNQMLLAADAGGTMSKEYQQAAKQAGNIADKIGDAKDEAKVFANDTAFGAIGTRVGLLKEKVMTLDFKGVGEQLKGLGKIILANPLMLLAAVLIGIGATIYALRDKIPAITMMFDAVGKSIDWLVQKAKALSDWMGLTTFALDEKTKSLVSNASEEQKSLEERYDKEIKMAQAAGKEVIDLEIKKQKAIRDSAMASVVHLLSKKKLNEEEKKLLEEQSLIASKSVNELDVLEVKAHEAKKKRLAEKAALDNKEAEETALRMKKLEEDQAKAYAKRVEARVKEDMAIIEELNKKIETELAFEQHLFDEKKKLKENEQKERQGQLNSELISQQQFMDSLVAVIVLASVSEDKRLKNLAKGFTIFVLDQLEKQLLATQAAAIAKATAQALAAPDSALTFGATGLARAVILVALIKGAFAVAKATIGKFETGTDFAPGGLAFVGEKGKELITSPSGKTFLSPDSTTLMNLPRGSKVTPNEKTMRILAANGLTPGNSVVPNDFMLAANMRQLGNTIKETNSEVVKAIVESSTDYAAQGSLLLLIKKKVDGSKKIIHSRAMGY